MTAERTASLPAAILAAPAALGALAVLWLLPAGAVAKPNDPVPSRLLVTAREYGFTLSRPKLDAGPSIIQLHNFGEDPHDLELQRVGGRTVSDLGEVLPGATGSLELRLRRKSRYKLWCSIPGHAELGMKASLRTSAKRPPRRR
jgi:hypothetical protein